MRGGSPTAELHEKVVDQSLHGLTLLAQTIDAGKASGAFRVDDSWQAAGTVWAALNGVLVLMAHPLRQTILRSDVATMFQATLNLVLRGLKDGGI